MSALLDHVDWRIRAATRIGLRNIVLESSMAAQLHAAAEHGLGACRSGPQTDARRRQLQRWGDATRDGLRDVAIELDAARDALHLARRGES